MGDLSGAIDLYEWNIAISGAMFETLGTFEVLMRNAMHERLSSYYARRYGSAEPWYKLAPLDQQGKADVAKAIGRATASGKVPEIAGKVVAELSFGFWFFLLSSRYQAVLWPAIKPGFSGHPDRRKVAPSTIRGRVEQLHKVRNRVAHHEPLFKRDIQRDFDMTTEAAAWICSDTASWMRRNSRVPTVLAVRPTH